MVRILLTAIVVFDCLVNKHIIRIFVLGLQMLDRLSDVMTFGALEPCPECKEGQLVYRSGVGYQCMGNISEWTKCQYKTLKPVRREFKIPEVSNITIVYHIDTSICKNRVDPWNMRAICGSTKAFYISGVERLPFLPEDVRRKSEGEVDSQHQVHCQA